MNGYVRNIRSNYILWYYNAADLFHYRDRKNKWEREQNNYYITNIIICFIYLDQASIGSYLRIKWLLKDLSTGYGVFVVT